MHFSSFLTTSLLAAIAAAIPLNAGPTNSGVAPPSCRTEAGTGYTEVTSTQTVTATADTCTSGTPAPAKRAVSTSKVKATLTKDPGCPIIPPTSTLTYTVTATETATTTTQCPGPTGAVQCDATAWEVPYCQYEPNDPSLGLNWWTIDAGDSLQASIDPIGLSPASWNNWNPWEFYGFHVAPTGQGHATTVNTTATSYEDICAARGRPYTLDLIVGAIEGKVPANATVSVKVGSVYLIKNFSVCVGDYACTNPSWNLHTDDGQRILTTEIVATATMEGTPLSDPSIGFYNRLEVSVSYPSDVAATGDNGIYVTHVWVRKSY
jgi:hypothetical protein